MVAVAYVASVSLLFRNKERGTRGKDRAKMAQVKEWFCSYLVSLRSYVIDSYGNENDTIKENFSLTDS